MSRSDTRTQIGAGTIRKPTLQGLAHTAADLATIAAICAAFAAALAYPILKSILAG